MGMLSFSKAKSFLLGVVLMALLQVFLFLNQKPKSPPLTSFEGTAMTIDYKITIGSSLSLSQKKEVGKIILDTFEEINAVFNRWNPHSELSKLNALPVGITVKISKALEDFLLLVDNIVQLTEGRFDPTVEPLQVLWKQELTLGKRVDPHEIEELAPAIGWDKIHFSEGYFYKDHPQTRLDLGGVAKGYCVDLLVERLNAQGHANVLVEWGGEMRASGSHPENRPWQIFISRFGDPDPKNGIATLSLRQQSIATSGDYLQQWTVNDPLTNQKLTYFHIIDPRTLYPLLSTEGSIGSTTVLAPTCVFADALATALMIFSSAEEAEEWVETIGQKMEGLKVWIETNRELVSAPS